MPDSIKIKILLQCRIGETCFTSRAVIGKIYSNQPKNMNHVHNNSTELVLVITTMRTDITGGDTLFYDGVKHT